MTTLLKKAIAKAKALPKGEQDAAAALLLDYVANVEHDIKLSDEQRAEVRRRLKEKKPRILTLKQLETRLRRKGML